MTENAQRRTQEERKAQSKRRIVRAAIGLIAEQGYMRTTLNEVGKTAGYTGGLVSHRFSSKEGLLQAVVKHIGSRFLEDQLKPSIQSDNAEEALSSYIAIYLRETRLRESRIRALYVIMGEAVGSVPEIRPEIASLNQRVRSMLAQIVQRGIDSGEFRKDANAESSAIVILGVLRGVTMQALADATAFNMRKLIPEIQRHVLADLKRP